MRHMLLMRMYNLGRFLCGTNEPALCSRSNDLCSVTLTWFLVAQSPGRLAVVHIP